MTTETNSEQIIHGTNCQKVPHSGIGYLHGADDDTPYDVDGVTYCGRCHHGLDATDISAARGLPPISEPTEGNSYGECRSNVGRVQSSKDDPSAPATPAPWCEIHLGENEKCEFTFHTLADISFQQAKDALLKFRLELDYQISNEQKCPFHTSSSNTTTPAPAGDEATPRTDAWIMEYRSWALKGTDPQLVDFARTLERDLSASRRDVEEITRENAGLKASAAHWIPVFKETEAKLATVTEQLQAAIAERDTETARWQDAIQAICQRLTPERNIDGSGCDSGDPLDLTLTEVQQAIGWHSDERDAAESRARAAEGDREQARIESAMDRQSVLATTDTNLKLLAELNEANKDGARLRETNEILGLVIDKLKGQLIESRAIAQKEGK